MGGTFMNEKIKIVLADDNRDFCQVLREYLSNEDDIEILGIAKDGIEALDLVNRTQPDVLVLDVIMPHLDGLGVIEKLNSMNLPKKTISTNADLTKKESFFLAKLQDVRRYRDVLNKNKLSNTIYNVIENPMIVKDNIEPTYVQNKILKDMGFNRTRI